MGVEMGRWRTWWASGLWASMLTVAVAAPSRVERLEITRQPDSVQITVALDAPAQFRLFTLAQPDRIVLDVLPARLAASALPLPAGAGPVRQLRAANRPDGSVRLVLDTSQAAQPRARLEPPTAGRAPRIVVEVPMERLQASVPAPERVSAPAPVPAPVAAAVPVPAPVTPAPPESAVSVPAPAGSTGDTRAPVVPSGSAVAAPRGRDVVIAVDAGHGGKDPGAHGPRGVLEKEVTLRIARELVAAIDAEPGMRGVLTRGRDEFIPLRLRMERARAAQADLFVSVHADAVRNRSVRGASVYVLNEKGATDEAARRLAARENAADLIGGVSLGDRDPMLASVLLDLSQNAALGSSIEVADDILRQMARVGTVRKPHVMQAPFMVLKSPDVPSVLVETAYISNPDEERRLDTGAYRQRLATAIFAGVRDYFYRNPPRGTLVAELSRGQVAAAVEHVIRPGESLSAIAARYNVSVVRIREANRLAGDRIVVGQVLQIPLSSRT